MVARHIIFAGLFATASIANAGLVGPTADAPKAAWSYNAGSAQAGPADSLQGASAGQFSYTSNVRMGDKAATQTTLMAQKTFSAAPAASATTAVAADVSGLVNPGTVIAADVVTNVGIAPAAVPEPATGLLMLAGLLGAGALTRRRK
jgi:hypothetical protein